MILPSHDFLKPVELPHVPEQPSRIATAGNHSLHIRALGGWFATGRDQWSGSAISLGRLARAARDDERQGLRDAKRRVRSAT